MDTAARDELARRLRVFVDGEDRSKDFVAKLEGFFIEHGMHEDRKWDELGTALASYGPAGVEPGLYDKGAMVNTFKEALHDLDDHRHCTHPASSTSVPQRLTDSES